MSLQGPPSQRVTGLVLAGEDITEAAEREVLEETGIHARSDECGARIFH